MDLDDIFLLVIFIVLIIVFVRTLIKVRTVGKQYENVFDKVEELKKYAEQIQRAHRDALLEVAVKARSLATLKDEELLPNIIKADEQLVNQIVSNCDEMNRLIVKIYIEHPYIKRWIKKAKTTSN